MSIVVKANAQLGQAARGRLIAFLAGLSTDDAHELAALLRRAPGNRALIRKITENWLEDRGMPRRWERALYAPD